MRRVLAVLSVALLAGLCGAPAARGEGDPVVGEWTLFTSFGGREMESQVSIERDASGTLSGTYTDGRGRTGKLLNPSFEDGVLRFARTMGPRTIAFEGRVVRDRLTGFHRLGAQEVPAEGARGAAAIAALRAERAQTAERGDDVDADYARHARRATARDAFPVLFDPELTPAAEARDIRDDEPVIGVALGGEAKAYPISIMGRHELANDTCGGQPIAASW